MTSFDLWSTYKAQLACKLSRRFTYMSYMTTALIISEKQRFWWIWPFDLCDLIWPLINLTSTTGIYDE